MDLERLLSLSTFEMQWVVSSENGASTKRYESVAMANAM